MKGGQTLLKKFDQAGESDLNMASNLIDIFFVNPHAAFYINGKLTLTLFNSW